VKHDTSSVHDYLDKLYDAVPIDVAVLTYACLIALIANEFTEKAFERSIIPTQDLKVKVLIAVVILATVRMNVALNQVHRILERLRAQQNMVVEVLPSHETIDMRELLMHRSNIRILTLSGTKAGLLGDAGVQQALSDPRRQSRVTILLGNPFSIAVRSRYQTDEPGTYEAGVDGITRRLLWLNRIITNLPDAAKKRLDVRVYANYPTVSLVQAESDLYWTVYGFKLRGGDCPRLRADSSATYGKFLINHFDKVYESAIPLAQWIQENKAALDAGEQLNETTGKLAS
jgi:hypothetical protein